MKKEKKDILCLILKLKALEGERESRYRNIVSNRQRDLRKIDSVEHLDREFFDRIDEKIEKVERLLELKRNKINKKS